MTEDQTRQRFDRLFTKALNNPRNASLSQVVEEMKKNPEFKDWDLSGILGGELPPEIYDDAGGMVKFISTDPAEYDKLRKEGMSGKRIIYDEILKREDPEQYVKQAHLRKIMGRFDNAIDREQNIDETFAALFYMMQYTEEEFRFNLVELKGEDPAEIKKKIEQQRELSAQCSVTAWRLQHDL